MMHRSDLSIRRLHFAPRKKKKKKKKCHSTAVNPIDLHTYYPAAAPLKSVRSAHLGKMSALQTFMLVVDHNKDEATQIANQIAKGIEHYPMFASTSKD